MLERVLAKLTYSNVMATVAVFLALGGGAYALSIPRDSVGARQIKRNAVRASEVKAGAVRSSEVKDASLLARDFRQGQLPAGPPGKDGAPGEDGAAGPRGLDGSARAYGYVLSNGTLDPNKSRNASVSRSSTGIYCIALEGGIDPATTQVMAVVDFAGSETDLSTVPTGGDDQGVIEVSKPGLSPCQAGQYRVNSYMQDFNAGAFAGNALRDQDFFFLAP